MMGQLLAHLVGDYILQTDRMASKKTSSLLWAAIHGAVYTLPFLLLTQHPLALLVIWLSHTVIDRWRLARYVVECKNWVTEPWVFAQVTFEHKPQWQFVLPWRNPRFATPTGYPDELPAYLSFGLLIMADNTMHLLINYAALRWF